MNLIYALIFSDTVSASVDGSQLTGLGCNHACCQTKYPEQKISPYVLPYPVGKEHNIRQANCNPTNSHNKKYSEQFAYDFEMPIGSKIVAARAGRIFYIVKGFPDLDPNYKPTDMSKLHKANAIFIDHGDGTYSKYGHLKQNGVLVNKGELVKQGQLIGLSGNSGQTRGPHLHFSVKSCPNGKVGTRACISTPITFENTRPHPYGLQGSPTSQIGGGEIYRALLPVNF